MTPETSPGVISVGATREVERLIHQAVELHLEALAEEGSSDSASVQFRRVTKIHSAA